MHMYVTKKTKPIIESIGQFQTFVNEYCEGDLTLDPYAVLKNGLVGILMSRELYNAITYSGIFYENGKWENVVDWGLGLAFNPWLYQMIKCDEQDNDRMFEFVLKEPRTIVAV